MSTPIASRDALEKSIWELVHTTPATDMLTSLRPADGNTLLQWGIDAMLTTEEMVEEVFRIAPMRVEEWQALSQIEQADHVWHFLFIQNSPISEACRNILTMIGMLDCPELNPGTRDLDSYRAWFSEQTPAAQFDRVVQRANLSCLVMTSNPFDTAEYEWWLSQTAENLDSRIHMSLDLTALLSDWKETAIKLKDLGILDKVGCDKANRNAVLNFLSSWCERTQAITLTVNLPVDFDPGAQTNAGRTFRDCILKLASERELPVILTSGHTTPAKELQGIIAGATLPTNIGVIETLCNQYQDIEFFLSAGEEGEQYALCAAARRCSNLTPFGIPTTLSNPKAMTEVYRIRLELLGLTSVPIASAATVLEQLLSRWAHSRWILGRCLQEEYRRLWRTGWRPTREELERDIAALLNNNFWSAAIPQANEPDAPLEDIIVNAPHTCEEECIEA